jgi:hypothetical protein
MYAIQKQYKVVDQVGKVHVIWATRCSMNHDKYALAKFFDEEQNMVACFHNPSAVVVEQRRAI